MFLHSPQKISNFRKLYKHTHLIKSMVFISKRSEHELIMEDTLDEIVRMMELTPLRMEDARRIINEGYNLLQKCEELRKSRDNHKNKFDELNTKFKALKNGN